MSKRRQDKSTSEPNFSPSMQNSTSSIIKKYLDVRSRSTELCQHLTVEDFVIQPAVFASPVKWHLAHTTWFFEEFILKKHAPAYNVFSNDFTYLFNSYYNNVGKRTERHKRGMISRPGIDQVLEYRHHVNLAIESLLKQEKPSTEVISVLELGINHEQQHQELLLTDLKYLLWQNPTMPVYKEDLNLLTDRNNENGWLTLNAGLRNIGYRGKTFHFDNERGRHKVFIQDCKLSRSLVTNGEYLEFLNDGGYNDFRFWLDEGWTWVLDNKIKSPLYWKNIDGKWFQFTLAGLKKMDLKAILGHVSYYEANAYATWKKMRLPTEFEWEAASKELSWGTRWEWTGSAYLPYPGYKIKKGALGEYNGKFMVNQMVLRGSSVATSKGHSRSSYRNFFHPHYQWQYSGIRLAK
ncbi:MAG: ergothioneine biosynthesis protein EgtB [Vicingaceae bacterium]